MSEKPIVENNYLLEKFPGKGGWTYAQIPEIIQERNNPFGWVRVCGFIDDFVFKNYHLMPMGNGKLFLPVKAQIRKQIKKQAGDYVRIILFKDDSPVEIPEELELCFSYESNVLETFKNYTKGEQKAFIEWIYSAKKEETKADRIAKTIQKIINGEKMN